MLSRARSFQQQLFPVAEVLLLCHTPSVYFYVLIYTEIYTSCGGRSQDGTPAQEPSLEFHAHLARRFLAPKAAARRAETRDRSRCVPGHLRHQMKPVAERGGQGTAAPRGASPAAGGRAALGAATRGHQPPTLGGLASPRPELGRKLSDNEGGKGHAGEKG